MSTPSLLPVAFIPVVISIPIALFILHFLAIQHLELSNSLSAATLPPAKAQTVSKTNMNKNRTRSKAKHSRNISIGSIVVTKELSPQPPSPPLSISHTHLSRDMSYSYPSSPTSSVAETLVEDSKVRQPYDTLLVLDVEATCSQGVGFDFPNEIIVRLLPADYRAAFQHACTSRNFLWSCFDGQTEKTTVEQAS